MGVRRTRRNKHAVLVGQPDAHQNCELQRLRRASRHSRTITGRQFRAKSVWALRYGRRRRSVGVRLLAQRLQWGPAEWVLLGKAELPRSGCSRRLMAER